MKLRNKKTGYIREGEEVILENLRKNGSTLNAINIDEIKEEWIDYDEAKEYWFISGDGLIFERSEETYPEDASARKEIGNYFETKEEAKEALRKLKAWKRLKDYGFRFTKMDCGICGGHIGYELDTWDRHCDEFVEKLFGGEE